MLFFEDSSGEFGVWVTLSRLSHENDAHGGSSANFCLIENNNLTLNNVPFSIMLLDFGSSEVYGRDIDEGPSESKGYLLNRKHKDKIRIKITKTKSDKMSVIDLSIWAPQIGSSNEVRILGPVSLSQSNKMDKGISRLLKSIYGELQNMITKMVEKEKIEVERQCGYMDLTRRINEFHSSQDTRFKELLSGFSLILNEKNREIANLNEKIAKLNEENDVIRKSNRLKTWKRPTFDDDDNDNDNHNDNHDSNHGDKINKDQIKMKTSTHTSVSEKLDSSVNELKEIPPKKRRQRNNQTNTLSNRPLKKAIIRSTNTATESIESSVTTTSKINSSAEHSARSQPLKSQISLLDSDSD